VGRPTAANYFRPRNQEGPKLIQGHSKEATGAPVKEERLKGLKKKKDPGGQKAEKNPVSGTRWLPEAASQVNSVRNKGPGFFGRNPAFSSLSIAS